MNIVPVVNLDSWIIQEQNREKCHWVIEKNGSIGWKKMQEDCRTSSIRDAFTSVLQEMNKQLKAYGEKANPLPFKAQQLRDLRTNIQERLSHYKQKKLNLIDRIIRFFMTFILDARTKEIAKRIDLLLTFAEEACLRPPSPQPPNAPAVEARPVETRPVETRPVETRATPFQISQWIITTLSVANSRINLEKGAKLKKALKILSQKQWVMPFIAPILYLDQEGGYRIDSQQEIINNVNQATELEDPQSTKELEEEVLRRVKGTVEDQLKAKGLNATTVYAQAMQELGYRLLRWKQVPQKITTASGDVIYLTLREMGRPMPKLADILKEKLALTC